MESNVQKEYTFPLYRCLLCVFGASKFAISMASISDLAPLPMSQKKEELLKHLNMGPETYTLMAKEADRVYKWLTSEKRHLKKNCKRKPPYDWSDIAEKSKDEAMARIAESGDAHTNYYWNLAVPTEDCPNWIARWFLYHKFRYRDGRNRNPARSEEKHSSHGSSSKHPHHKHSGVVDEDHGYCDSQTTYYPSVSTTTGQSYQGYGYGTAGPSSLPSGYTYEAGQSYDNSTQSYTPDGQDDEQELKIPYDPVRDV